ncbi:MAG TPA: PH domain-containing protein [Allosphingosinicella sp.]|nr:PH domain-containing protein [Allosphingosinicella sp.]
MRILDVDQVPPLDAAVLTAHLVTGEAVHAAYSAPTGAILFTDRRILMVQREHLLEARIETSSWPYRAVRHFSIQEGEAEDSRTAMRIWLGDETHPLHLRANPGADLRALQGLLADKLG